MFVPVRDGLRSLSAEIDRLIGVMDEYGEPYEVLVVDGGGRDETESTPSGRAETSPRVRVLRHERGPGLGAATRVAATSAKGEYLVGSPAEAPLDLAQIRAFHEAMEARASYSYFPGQTPCDIAVGYRPERAGHGAWTRLGSWILRWLVRAAFRIWLRDPTWISMYRRSIFERITIEEDGFVALPEILVKAKRLGLRMRQVPCPVKERRAGRGTLSRPSDRLRAPRDLLRLWLRLTLSRPAESSSSAETRPG